MSEKLDELLFFATVKLDYPIKDGQGNEIAELKIRRAKAKDIRKMRGETDIEQTLSLLAILTGLVPEDLDELDVADIKKASAIIEKMQKGKSA
ncbi:phage tail assembly protein [Pasteurella multocida subsp. multocida]|uniref:Phage tail assembly protein n=1 Tax=Pasteurella multocida TaxID=747 RepID=A0A9X3ZLK8_PASMD|nr:phage tail assembly protein [Pasteurella multocida]MBF6981395.1 phage tail assembly protein [Pasteurella multocida]MBF6983525.1 phage tail assembly protein [Pasteurella multocida]MDA5609311.1 phage tail assembly protein [Pasteurella multocida subsp. multocida]MDA5611512.1 phage tail assembly protein [Pasteurella multocida]MDA5613990.1 phage tail assembly protein [Pasteurella multocida]